MPRPTWATLESGSANPTLQVLIKAAAALRVSIEELIAAPRARGRVFAASSLPRERRADGVLQSLLPHTIPGLRLLRLELTAGAAWELVPESTGTGSYFFVERGRPELSLGAERHRLVAGDVLVTPADEAHHVQVTTREPCVAYRLVTPLPSGF